MTNVAEKTEESQKQDIHEIKVATQSKRKINLLSVLIMGIISAVVIGWGITLFKKNNVYRKKKRMSKSALKVKK